jgi:hypothetical protein
MKSLKISFSLVLCLSCMLIIGCGDEVNRFPNSPAMARGTTDASGEVTLDLGSHLITISVVNESGGTVGSMNVSAHLLKNYLAIFASGNSTYYPGYRFVPYDSLELKEDIVYAHKTASPQSAASSVEATVEVVLNGIDRDIYSYVDEPSYNDAVYSDTWLSRTGYTGTMETLYSLADSLDYSGGVFVHISSNVASLTNAPVRTVSIPLDQIADLATFTVLLGLEFYIFDADTLHLTKITHMDSLLPVVVIDSIIMVEGGFFAQFTLTWDVNPQDLDSHLWTPQIGGSYHHIAYYNRGNAGSAPYALLDVDDVTSYGPEHVAIYQGFAGTYTYAVHHYSGSSDIPHSGAEVSVLKPDRSVQTFTPPDGTAADDWYWHVCTIDGTTGQITALNVLSIDPPVTPYSMPIPPPKNYRTDR